MKRPRLSSLDRFLALPGDDAPIDDNFAALADLVGGTIIREHKSRIIKITDSIDLFPWSSIKDIPEHLRDDLYRQWHFAVDGGDAMLDPRRFLFFDLETTGLSGGTGIVAFLIGFGFFDGDQFQLIQYFMPDFPDEPILLEQAVSHISPETTLVTYNGKSYDWPLLTQRLTMNRHKAPAIAEHIDVLHPARALFRTLGEDCSLKSLEKSLLQFDRGEDIPGYLIPTKYFDYLYDRQPGMIPDIIRHNRLDIISLALLTRQIPEILGRPEQITSHRLLEGVISHLWRRGRYSDLRNYIQQVGRGYLEECSTVALLQYSLALKSLGEYQAAGVIWRLAGQTKEGPYLSRHLLELAKHQEHREKEPEAALETVDLLLSLELPNPLREAVKHRRQRLLRKCSSAV